MHNNSFEAKFANQVIRYRYIVLLLSLIFVGFAGSGLKYLIFTTDHRTFFSEESPELLAYEELENTYNKNDNIMFVLAPANGSIFDPKVLSAVIDLTDSAWSIPYSSRVDSISNFQHIKADGDDMEVADLVEDPLTKSEQELNYIKNIAINEPRLVNRIISQRSHVTAINVTINVPGINKAAEIPEVVVFARQLADQFRQNYPDIEVYLGGMVMMDFSFSEASQNDMKKLVPISFLMMLVILGVLLRSILLSLATLFVILFSIVPTMGIGALLGIPITPPSSITPMIILTVAVAGSVHILVSFLQAYVRGSEKDDAIIESVRLNLQPVFLASFTTALGFLSLNFSEVPPFNHLGNLAALGVMISFLFVVSFLPALMSILPIKPKQAPATQSKLLENLAEFVLKRRTPLLIIMTGFIVATVSFVPRNELNDVFVHYFDEDIEFRRSVDFTTDNLTGLYLLDYSLECSQADCVYDPDYLKQLESFTKWLRQQPEVIHVDSITDTFNRINQALNGDNEQWYRLPEEREYASQIFLLYELSLPFGLDTTNQVSQNKSSTRLRVTSETLSSTELINFEERVQNFLQAQAPILKNSGGTGTMFMFTYISKRNIISMLLGAMVALLLISLVILVSLRSFKVGAMSMISNLAPSAMGFGLWGLFVGEIGIGLSVVTGVTIGIVVDDTVHFLSKYLRARREQNLEPEDAIRYSFANVGVALAVTSLVLVIGFLVLALSSFKLNSSMGLLTATVIGIALIVELLLLPPMLLRLDKGRAIIGEQPEAAENDIKPDLSVAQTARVISKA